MHVLLHIQHNLLVHMVRFPDLSESTSRGNLFGGIQFGHFSFTAKITENKHLQM